MKILYLITGLNSGGAEKNLREIIRRLSPRNFEIIVCSLTNTFGIVDDISPFIKKLYFLNSRNYFSFFKSLIKLRKIIEKDSPEIIHCFLFHANILGRLAALPFKIKVICSIRNKLIKNKIGNYVDRLTQRLVDLYTVNSRSLQRYVISYGINFNKIKIIENLIDFNRLKFLRSKDKLKCELGLDDNPVISMIANIRKQKDYPTIIKAIHFLIKSGNLVNFLIVGDKNLQKKETRNILNLIHKFNLNNVKVLGFRRDIPDILNITDIWVSSTLFEGQSNALLEAMAMKKPIITTNIPENSEVVRDHQEALLVPPKSPERMANAIKKIMTEEHLSKKLANNAYLRVHKMYNLQKTIIKVEKLYEEIIRKKFLVK